MATLSNVLTQINEWIWGLPLIFLLLGTGLYFTCRLGLLQFFRLPLAFRLMFKKDDQKEGDVSSFQALCTALSSTIGTGNIVGVATAIIAGGPGALFWMWISAFLGMATKYSEGLLAIVYRQRDEKGQMSGGPMYYLEKGLKHKTLGKILARCFAVFGVGVALLGIGTFTQVRSISDAASLTLHIPPFVTGIFLAITVGFITIGGIKRIASVSEVIVPFMSVAYIVSVILIIITQSYLLGVEGSAMTTLAFQNGFPIGEIGIYVVNIGLLFFAFTTIIGWNYYGEKCIQYLLGEKAILPYKILFIVLIGIGPFMSLDFVFTLADIVNGCMAFPNLIGLIALRKVVVNETRAYFKTALSKEKTEDDIKVNHSLVNNSQVSIE